MYRETICLEVNMECMPFKYTTYRQSDIVLEFPRKKTYPILLKTVDLCLEMSSDVNYNLGFFIVEEIFELGNTIKSRCLEKLQSY